MTQPDPSGWMSPLLGPLTIQVNGVEIAVYRGTWNFTGASVTDDAVNARLDFAMGSSFASGVFKIANPLGTFFYTFAGSAILANRTVTFPLLTGNDSFVFEAHTQTLTNKTLTSPVINGQAQGAAVAVAALEIGWTLGAVFTKTLAAGGNVFTFAGAASGMCIIVRLTSNGGGSTVTWPAVEWAGGVAPTQTATGVDVYTFVHDGALIYGSVVQNYT
jgi:hypothetical protein